MAFCGNCGNELEDGLNFCPTCGRKVGSSNTLQNQSGSQTGLVQQTMTLRNQSIAELNRIYGYFSKKSSLYDEYESLINRLDPNNSRPSTALLKAGLAVLLISAPFILLFLVFYISERDELRADPNYSLTEVLVAFAIIGVILAGGIILIALHFRGKKNLKKKEDQMRMRLCDISNELHDYYVAYGPCLIGPEYTNPQIISQIAQTIQAGRADTPKEAINRMLDDAHRSQVEYQMMMTTRAAQQAARAANAAAVAAFCSPSFFLILHA